MACSISELLDDVFNTTGQYGDKNKHRPKHPDLYFIYVTSARTGPKTIKSNTALSLK
jgi:hypothetical protein